MINFNLTYDPGLQKIFMSDIGIGPRFRRDLKLTPAFVDSIRTQGLLAPILVDINARVIAGARRVAACRQLGWGYIDAKIVDLDRPDQLRCEHDENVQREGFTPSEMVAIGEAIEEMERAAAKGRMVAAHASCGNFPQLEQGKTRDKVAASLGVSGKTYEKMKTLVRAAEAEPEKYGALREDMDRTGRVENVYRRLKAAKQSEAIRAELPPLPNRGPYRVIVADPPWQYDLRQTDPSNRKILEYPSMSTAAICALNVASIAHGDCVLWLWTTNAHMFQAKEVLDAWGFEPKTILTWVKDRMGLGNWLRGQTEHCIMAVRGKPTVVLTNKLRCCGARCVSTRGSRTSSMIWWSGCAQRRATPICSLATSGRAGTCMATRYRRRQRDAHNACGIA
jgi:hypothetical protein